MKGLHIIHARLFFGFAVIGIMAITAGCSTSQTAKERVAVVSEDGAEAARRGRILAATECTTCHRAYHREEYSPGEWSEIIKRMGARVSLDAARIKDLKAYFVTEGTTARPK
jgi:hypothetical protein